MEPDFICSNFGLMIVPFSFLFFPKIYYNRRLVFPFFIVTIILAIIGLVLPRDAPATKPNFYLFLICPLFSLTVLRVQLFIFNKALKRNPKRPPRSIFLDDGSFGWDRLFYFVFMLLSLVVPIGLLAYFYD